MILEIFKKCYAWLGVPALLIHELLHVVFALFLGGKISWLKLDLPNKARINVNGLKTLTSVRIVAMAPLTGLLIALILPALLGLKYSLVTAYFIFNLRNTLPSYLDFKIAEMKPPAFYNLIFKKSFEDSIKKENG